MSAAAKKAAALDQSLRAELQALKQIQQGEQRLWRVITTKKGLWCSPVDGIFRMKAVSPLRRYPEQSSSAGKTNTAEERE